MTKQQSIRWLGLFLAVTIVAAGCGDDDDSGGATTEATATTEAPAAPESAEGTAASEDTEAAEATATSEDTEAAEASEDTEASAPAPAGNDCEIKAGWVVPVSGALASYAQMTEWVVANKLSLVESQGGVAVGDQTCDLVVEIYDSQSTVAGSSEAAARAVLDDGVDVLMAQGTPDTTNAPTEVCEREGVPCITSDTPVEAWLFNPDGTEKEFNNSFHFFFAVPDLVANHLGMIAALPGGFNGKIGYLYPNDADGVVFHSLFDPAFEAQGWEGVDPGRFEQGIPDFSAIVNQFRREDVEVVTGVLAPPDLQNYLQQAAQAGFAPKMYIIDKGTGFPDAINAIGEAASGVLSVNFWSPAFPGSSSFGGWTGQEFVDAYESANPGHQYTPAGAWEDAVFDVLLDALSRSASTDSADIVAALSTTDVETITGQVKFNEKHYSASPLGGAQWRYDAAADLWVKENVFNEVYPEVAITGELLIYEG